jgi:hypothetical protein
MITQAKVKTDRRDALALAKLLRAGLIPQAYIYPASTRPVRDLLRRRHKLVDMRAYEYGSIRQLLLRQGLLSSSRNQIKLADVDDLKQWFTHPLVVMNASLQLERIELLSRQIRELEQQIFLLTGDKADYKRLLEPSSARGCSIRQGRQAKPLKQTRQPLSQKCFQPGGGCRGALLPGRQAMLPKASTAASRPCSKVGRL